MKKDTVKIVIIGDVDHGKSTLIGRLLLETKSLSRERLAELQRISKGLDKELELAFLADQLKEEREEERTIDTTQIFFKTRVRRFCLIDTPGHLEFIKNMMTGATQAERALLIIDVRAGLKEQTRRYAHILSMLGFGRVIVLINKMDLVAYGRQEFEKAKEDILFYLKGLALAPDGVIPISAKNGDNIAKRSKNLPWYQGPCLLRYLDSIRREERLSGGPLRLPVQDVYKVGDKSVIVGRIESGCVKTGQEVLLCFLGRTTRVSSLMIFGKKKTWGCEGENVGLLLRDHSDVKRGEVICQKEKPPVPTQSILGRILWLSSAPLRIGDKITFRCGTQEVLSRAARILERIDSSTLEVLQTDSEILNTNEVGSVVFETERPVVVERADRLRELSRFVIESAEDVSGVGIIF